MGTVTTGIAAKLCQRGGLLLAVMFAVQCGHAGSPTVSAQEKQGAKVVGALREKVDSLKTAFPDAEVELDATRERVTRIRGLKGESAATSAEEVALSVLKKPAVATALGLSTDLRELCPPVSRKDPQIPDYAVVRMQQCVNGIKVLGAELVMSVRVKPAPVVDTLTSSLRPEIPRSGEPKISADDAIKAADTAAKERGSKEGVRAPQPPTGPANSSPPELVFFVPTLFQLQGPSRLCWLVRKDRIAVLVDATDGTVVHQYYETLRGVS